MANSLALKPVGMGRWRISGANCVTGGQRKSSRFLMVTLIPAGAIVVTACFRKSTFCVPLVKIRRLSGIGREWRVWIVQTGSYQR